MSEADFTRAAILEGAEKAAEASRLIEQTRLTGNTVGASINQLKANINQELRQVLVDISRIRDSREAVSQFLAGSGVGYVANGVALLNTADDELQDTARKLKFLNDEIETWQREIIPVIDRDLTEQSGRVREAAAQFRTYANVL